MSPDQPTTFAAALRTPSLRRAWWWVASTPLVLVLVAYQAVAPVGHWALLFLESLYALGALGAAGAVCTLPLLAIRRDRRMIRLAWWLVALVYLPLCIFGLRLGARIRARAFHDLARRSVPLVSAVRAYEAAHGQPPPDLAILVPTYLPRVPGTGMMAYPRYEYHTGLAARRRFAGNPWALVVPAPSGGINFDQFLYFPLQNYPRRGYGGSIVRMEDWAYVYE